jgi:hypothetical protein
MLGSNTLVALNSIFVAPPPSGRVAPDAARPTCHAAPHERRRIMHRPSFFPALFAGFLLTVLALAPSVATA